MRILPTDVKIKKEAEEGAKGTFVIEPLPQGFGYTLGNSLRRALLTSLTGGAITQVKFAGVPHQFTTIKGVKEDVVELCLNLKKVRIKVHGENPVVLKLSKSGPADVKASDFEVPSDAVIVNKDLHIATLADKSTRLELEAVAESGSGYVPAEEKESSKIGVILLDSVFSPVTVVSYNVEPTRVGRETDLDKLVLNVQTDGTLSPFDALTQAAGILQKYFERVNLGVEEMEGGELDVKESVSVDGKKEDVYLEELPLPTRTINALKKAGIRTLSDLSSKLPEELTEVKNLGDKSIEEIKKLLEREGIK
ncbi:DNA-directed RNA polymerase subunit alpha [candidate division WWE3 bacterium]|nr:DNA-directed RNA polymerase subunit alpha [candidate division WWE3 bacterium]